MESGAGRQQDSFTAARPALLPGSDTFTAPCHMKALSMTVNRPQSAARLLLPIVAAIVSGVAPGQLPAQEDAPASASQQRVDFNEHFLPQTMRVDYFHSGTASEQHVALDAVVDDGPWAGSRRQLVDQLDLGEYSFQVRDQQSDQLLYSRGFCSVFGEWKTIPEAKQRWGTFHESLRFPWPQRPVKVVLRHRPKDTWQQIWSTSIDPESRFVTTATTPRRDKVWEIFTHGDPSRKVDIVVLGDGFTKEDMPSFHAAARELTEALFSVEPFKSRRSDFNVRAIDVVAAESGVSKPRDKDFRRSPLSCQYNTFDLPRYALTFDNKAVRDVAAQAPYDCLVILMNDPNYGGGGIYSDQTIVTAHHSLAKYVMIHEFGHHIGGLGDEYYSSNVAYETGKPITFEPWEPNVTALVDFKWKDLVAADVPIPTPWNKEAFESFGRRKPGHSRDSRSEAPKSLSELLAENKYAGQVGAFEGARYESQGLYRPTVNCVMFSRSTNDFCPVCRRAIEAVIDSHTK